MYTVVVADDEIELRKAIIRKIPWEEIGFRVVGEAENGVEALELVGRLEPDLLITDIRMPFISGIELARQVREIRPSTQIAFLSGYDDFTYAQQAIQYNIISYLLKPISMVELTENLKLIRQKIDRLFLDFSASQKNETDVAGFLLPLLLDGFQTDNSQEREEKLRRQAEAAGILKPEGGLKYIVMSTALRDEAGNSCTEQNHVHAIDSILKKYIKYASFYLEDRIVSLLMGTPASFHKYLHILSEDIIQSIERILGVHGCVGVSREVDSLTALHEAYRESVNAIRYADRTSSSICYISDLEPFGGMNMEYVANTVADVENRMRIGSAKEIEEYLEKLFGHLGQSISSRKLINFFLVELLSCACRLMSAVSEEMAAEMLKEDSFMQRMSFLDSSLEEAAGHFTKFCSEVCVQISEEKKKSGTNLCERALKKVDENFSNADLSLISVSGEIGVSPNYLSTLIKKKTGKTFIDYLTQMRMDEAKKLLLGTSMKIREISERCGYSDQHYFSYCFKKYAGVSPNMLRQQVESGESL